MKKISDIQKLTIYSAPEQSPGYLLWRISTQWRSTIEQTLKSHNLTHPQFVVLATTAWLTKDTEHISQIDICKMSELDPNTVSQILRGLEAKNFIHRTRSLNERSKSPVLTAMGKKVIAQALPAVEHADTQFFNKLNTQELDQLINTFQKLILKKKNL